MEEIKTGVFKIRTNIPIYIIGDIHGDYQCLIHCLVDLCNVANITEIKSDKFDVPNREHLEWETGNNSVVIFCGDLIHRKRFQDTVLDDECSDIFIIKTLFHLKKSAQKSGGDIIIISGNHEIMNIVEPSDSMYTSGKNIQTNMKYFSSQLCINNYISNTYAWIKLNDILIAHGGLCSDYLKFLDTENQFEKKIFSGGSKITNNDKSNIMIGGDIIEFGDDVIKFVNDKYRSFFKDYSKNKAKTDPIGFKLFIEYDFKNKHKHNMFWCREWGYSGINCNNLDELVKKVGCEKMIIAHCPQFLSNDKPKMINFECVETSTSTEKDKDKDKLSSIQKFKIARVDLGMSRSFEYNKSDEFIKFLTYNYNRKMSVLKLSYDDQKKNYYFNYDSVIAKKISCLQYLLLKYGITKKEWEEKKIKSDWLGFEYIDSILKSLDKDNLQKCGNQNDSNNVVLCLLYPLFYSRPNLKSIEQFEKLN